VHLILCKFSELYSIQRICSEENVSLSERIGFLKQLCHRHGANDIVVVGRIVAFLDIDKRNQSEVFLARITVIDAEREIVCKASLECGQW